MTAETHPDKEDRQRALADLQQLSQSLVEVRLPSGEWQRTRKNRPISASHRQMGITEALFTIGAYSHYLEIATCLTRFEDLMGPAWKEAEAGTSRDMVVESFADKLQIPAKWIHEWDPVKTSAYVWAREKTAWRLKTTPNGVAKLQREADRRVREFTDANKIAQAATERLMPLRKQRTTQRSERGEGSVHRRY